MLTRGVYCARLWDRAVNRTDIVHALGEPGREINNRQTSKMVRSARRRISRFDGGQAGMELPHGGEQEAPLKRCCLS